MDMQNCKQCGKTFDFSRGASNAGNPASPIWCCSGGCVDAYQRQHGHGKYNPITNAAMGLAGKAIGGVISGAKSRKQEQEQQVAFEKEQRLAQREERNRREAEEQAAASAARHVITHNVVCPICDADISASMASDGETKVRCKECKTRLKIGHAADVTVLGPKDEPISKAEDLQIKEDRICSLCKHYLSESKRNLKWFVIWSAMIGILYLLGFMMGWGLYWKIGGAILLGIVFVGAVVNRFVLACSSDRGELCESKEARSVTGRSNSDALPEYINRNLRCKFWEQKT